MGIESLAIGAVAAVSAIASSYAASSAAEDNRKAVEDTNRQNLALTHEQWDREANAVQTRKADLLAAGINPNLAAGSAAAVAPPARMEAAQRPANMGLAEGFKNIGSTIQGSVAMDGAKAQANLTRAQEKTEYEKQKNLAANSVNQLSNAGFKSQASRIMKKDADLWTNKNIDVRDRDAVSKVMKAFPDATDRIKNSVSEGIVDISGRKKYEELIKAQEEQRRSW